MGSAFCSECGNKIAAAPAANVTVILTASGANKINAIKAVREVAGLGLQEAEDLIAGAPQAVKSKITREEAETIRQQLVEAGCTVQIQ
jgi:large subunit ribosomal protein L7/L12